MSRLPRVRDKAIGVASVMLAIWIAARPTLLDAAEITTASPSLSPAMSMRPP